MHQHHPVPLAACPTYSASPRPLRRVPNGHRGPAHKSRCGRAVARWRAPSLAPSHFHDATRQRHRPALAVTTMVFWLGSINVVLGIFNLTPAFPGRRSLLRSSFAATDGLRRATRWASWIGQLPGHDPGRHRHDVRRHHSLLWHRSHRRSVAGLSAGFSATPRARATGRWSTTCWRRPSCA